jgi:tRNA(Ile)-lysidine synthase
VINNLSLNIEKKILNLKNKKIILAHSGGIDSSVLAHILKSFKINFSVAHCNFKLRIHESDKDYKSVLDWSKKNNIPFYFTNFCTKKYCIYSKKSIQLGARELRYNWFFDLMKIFKFDYLLTAHHLNDQFETFLINVLRGTGFKGLSGINETDKIIRPLLDFSKQDIINYSIEKKISWREDSSNVTNHYLRNKYRNIVIPLFSEIEPNFLNNFKSSIKNINSSKAFIDNAIAVIRNKIFKKNNSFEEVLINDLKNLYPYEFHVHELFAPFGFSKTEVIKLISSISGKQIFSDSHRLIKNRDKLFIEEKKEINDESFIINFENPTLNLPINLKHEITDNYLELDLTNNTAALDFSKIKKPFLLRKPKNKDYFRPFGMNGKKLISKYFKDEKYSLIDKENQWLLVSNGSIVWVVGKRVDKRFAANKSCSKILLITFS